VGIDLSVQVSNRQLKLQQKITFKKEQNFFAMDATNLLLPDNSFDTIIIPEVLEHIRSPEKC